jgi:uncharacterized protein YgiM (DUF1202 family)
MRRPRLTPNQALLLAFFLLSALTLASQTATVQRNSNLRKSPNTGSAILESLNQGDSVTLTSAKTRLGYYHVRASDGTLGWVWGLNVSTRTPNNAGANPPPTPNPGSGLAVQLAAAIVKAVPQALVISGHSVCGPTGKPAKPLNSSKNRTDIPDVNSYIPVDWNALASLPSGQANKVQGAPVEVEGYLSHKVNVEGAESTNCGLTSPDEVDWHMYLTNQPKQGIAQALIVETTPRTRPLHSWGKKTLDALVDSNTRVRISGWLMYDSEHISAIGTQRATVWEVHPITRIETQGANGNWKNIEGKP